MDTYYQASDVYGRKLQRTITAVKVRKIAEM
jgi:hypothetical protein